MMSTVKEVLVLYAIDFLPLLNISFSINYASFPQLGLVPLQGINIEYVYCDSSRPSMTKLKFTLMARALKRMVSLRASVL